jgi:hypothetical protein
MLTQAFQIGHGEWLITAIVVHRVMNPGHIALQRVNAIFEVITPVVRKNGDIQTG